MSKCKTKTPRKARRKRVSVLLDRRTAAALELWAEALGIDLGEAARILVRRGDRSLRIADRERIYTPEQRRQWKPVWDEIDRRLWGE